MPANIIEFDLQSWSVLDKNYIPKTTDFIRMLLNPRTRESLFVSIYEDEENMPDSEYVTHHAHSDWANDFRAVFQGRPHLFLALRTKRFIDDEVPESPLVATHFGYFTSVRFDRDTSHLVHVVKQKKVHHFIGPKNKQLIDSLRKATEKEFCKNTVLSSDNRHKLWTNHTLICANDLRFLSEEELTEG